MVNNLVVHTLHLKRFKMFRDVDIKLAPGINIFTGDHQAGKSSILEALDFARSLILAGKLYPYFTDHRYSPVVLTHDGDPLVKIGITFQGDSFRCHWECHWQAHEQQVEWEKLTFDDGSGLLTVWEYRESTVILHDEKKQTRFEQIVDNERQAWIGKLSFRHRKETFAHRLHIAIKQWAAQSIVWDILDPIRITEPSMNKKYTMPGRGGSNLSGYLARLGDDARDSVICEMQQYFPDWKSFNPEIQDNFIKIDYIEDHCSEQWREIAAAGQGAARLLAFSSLDSIEFPISCLLVEEISGWIERDLLKMLLARLDRKSIQTITTSHAKVDWPHYCQVYHLNKPSPHKVLVEKIQSARPKETLQGQK